MAGVFVSGVSLLTSDLGKAEFFFQRLHDSDELVPFHLAALSVLV